jgi:hypothetical protein
VFHKSKSNPQMGDSSAILPPVGADPVAIRQKNDSRDQKSVQKEPALAARKAFNLPPGAFRTPKSRVYDPLADL